jgi:transposase InsO family protein
VSASSSDSQKPVAVFGLKLGNHPIIDGTKCELIQENADGTALFRVASSYRPFFLTTDQIYEKLNDGSLCPDPESVTSQNAEATISLLLEKTRSGIPFVYYINFRLKIVRAILAIERGRRSDQRISDAIEEARAELVDQARQALLLEANSADPQRYLAWLVAQKLPSRPTAYRWKSASEDGRNQFGLIPSFSMRGRKGQSKFTDRLLEKLDRLIEKRFWKVPEENPTSASISVLQDLHDWARGQSEYSCESLPSNPTVIRRIRARGGKCRLEHDEGKRRANLEYKAVGKGPTYRFPSEMWEMDHTEADAVALDRPTGRVLGRAWLTLIADCATRMIVSYVLTVEQPNSAAVLAALRFAIRPKTKSELSRLGVVTAWPSTGPSRALTIDQGKDLTSVSVIHSMGRLGIDLKILPGRSPFMKGTIERLFRTLNDKLFHRLPGTTKSNPAKKGDRNPEKLAKIYFDELDALVAQTICDDYHNAHHSEIASTPLERWRKLTETYPVKPPPSMETLRMGTLLVASRTAARNGIAFENCRYNGDVISRIRSAKQAHDNDNPEIDIFYDPNEITRIYVKDPDNGAFVEVPAVQIDPVIDPDAASETTRQTMRLARKLVGSSRYPKPGSVRSKAITKRADEIARINQRRFRRVSNEDGTYERQPVEVPRRVIADDVHDRIVDDLPVKKPKKLAPRNNTKPKLASKILKF